MSKNYKHIYKWLTLLLCPVLIMLGYLLSLTTYTRYFIEVNKDGLINTVLVKNGWFWTTLVLFWCCYRYGVHRLRSIIRRYLILTIWWYLFTQRIPFIKWPPMMDAIFLLTGGDCHFNIWNAMGEVNDQFHDNNSRRVDKSFHILEKVLTQLSNGDIEDELLLQSLSCVRNRSSSGTDGNILSESLDCNPKINQYIKDMVKKEAELNTSIECREYGGFWTGGHDPSGHIFLLTLMIMLLLGELPHMINVAWGKYLHSIEDEQEEGTDPKGKQQNMKEHEKKSWQDRIKDCVKLLLRFVVFIVWDQPVLIMIWLLIIWSWSLMITTTSFHTFAEQLSGLFFAYSVAGVVYYKR